MQNALYFDSEGSQLRLMKAIKNNFAVHGLKVHAFVDHEKALHNLEQDDYLNDEPTVAIIGPEIEKAIVLARKIRGLVPDIQFLFLADSELSQLAYNLKSPAGGVSSDWEIVDTGKQDFAGHLNDKLNLLLKKRRFRTTLSGINRSLRKSSKPVVSDLNRYSVSLKYLAHIVEHAHDGIIATTLEGVIVKWNLAAENIFKLIASEAIGRSIFDIVPGQWAGQLPVYYRELMSTKAGYKEYEIVLHDAEEQSQQKQICDISLSLIRDESQQKIGVAAFVRDITERKISEKVLEDIRKDLERMSFEDGLTGISNRRQFDRVYQKEWQRMQRYCKPLSVALLDIDYFKNYNDNYGHLGGDECLKLVAKTLRKFTKRSSDLVARYGGEEFVLLLPDTSLDAAVQLAERCRDAVRELKIPHEYSRTDSCITISAGVTSVVPNPSLSPNSLLSEADALLYLAKRNGRNRVCMCR